MQGIYKIENKVNGKYYVGGTNNCQRRWREHQNFLGQGKHENVYLQHAWDKYGEASFTFVILEEVEGDLLSCEQRYLDDGFERGVLYNIARKADCPPVIIRFGKDNHRYGKKHTKETRAAMSKAHSGKNHHMYGKHHSEKAKANMSKAHMGKTISEETRAKLSEALKNSSHPLHGLTGEGHPLYGRRRSQEFIDKVSGGNHRLHGKKRSPETVAKMRAAAGKPYPAFYNAKTGERIPAGRDLTNMCQERNLDFWVLSNVKLGRTEQTQDGWMLEA